MFFISAYRQGKTWLFDDEARGILREPFVMGASELIQKYLNKKGIKKRKNVPLVFSNQEFPNAEVILTCTEKCYPTRLVGYTKKLVAGRMVDVSVREPDTTASATSAWYTDQEGDKCWLCPAQIKFFGEVADKIYAKIG